MNSNGNLNLVQVFSLLFGQNGGTDHHVPEP